MESIPLQPQMLVSVESSGSSNSTIMRSTNQTMQPLLWLLLLVILLSFVVYPCIRYFVSELPPFGSGLKTLPGPTSTLPYLGRIHDVDRMQPWTAMKKFSDKYNGLFACTLGGETHIWVARDDVAEDLLCNNAAISSARADLGVYPDVTKGFRYLPLLGYTEVFHRQRKFAHMVMTRSVNNKFYGHIDRQTKRLMHELTIEPNNWFNLLYLFCTRISAQLAYGSDDAAQDHLDNANMFLNQIGPSGPAPNLAPFLIVFPEWLVPGKRAVRLRQQAEDLLWGRVFNETKKSCFQEGLPNTYVNASLQAKALGEEKRLLFESETEASCAVGMLCTVAAFTIAGPATLFVMAMILHPEWQTKVREQIDEVVRDGMVDLKHSPQLPMLRAAIKECVRWKSTVPLGVPRLLAEDYSYDGYHFPKGAVVHVLDIALAQDPERYEDPGTYNPDRWLNEASPNYRSPLTEHPRLKGHHIFGRGKRVCPGQDLAEAELIVLCGNLLKFFTFGPAMDEQGNPEWPDPDRWTTDVIGGPLPFDCKFEIRDAARLDLVERLYREEFCA